MVNPESSESDDSSEPDEAGAPGLPGTASVRAAEWKVAPVPRGLLDRRVEITGPVDRKMIINARNSRASVFMADFEDSNSPTGRITSTARSICTMPSTEPLGRPQLRTGDYIFSFIKKFRSRPDFVLPNRALVTMEGRRF